MVMLRREDMGRLCFLSLFLAVFTKMFSHKNGKFRKAYPHTHTFFFLGVIMLLAEFLHTASEQTGHVCRSVQPPMRGLLLVIFRQRFLGQWKEMSPDPADVDAALMAEVRLPLADGHDLHCPEDMCFWFQCLESADSALQALAAGVLQFRSKSAFQFSEGPLAYPSKARMEALVNSWFRFVCNASRVAALQEFAPRLLHELQWYLAMVWGKEFSASGGSFKITAAGDGTDVDPAGVLRGLGPVVALASTNMQLARAMEWLRQKHPLAYNLLCAVPAPDVGDSEDKKRQRPEEEQGTAAKRKKPEEAVCELLLCSGSV